MQNNHSSGIILFAKQSGLTSFSSLYEIKHALNTTKVGHTGTLDSFADGLLVVCVGYATKLASRITAFNKEYEAVIAFGKETDTLELTGNIIKEKPLPTEEDLLRSVNHFTGEFLQVPPAFSAIHVDGKRASDLARKGTTVEIPKRQVSVFDSEILEIKKNVDDLVKYAKIRFFVSKGTYIRALARDIADFCGSAAHLVALRRTRVGNFLLKNAVGFSELSDFSIENALRNIASLNDSKNINKKQILKRQNSDDIKKALIDFSKSIALESGFKILSLKEDCVRSFLLGKPIKKAFFIDWCDDVANKVDFTAKYAVFRFNEQFCGVVTCLRGRFSYDFVVNVQ